MSKQKFPPKIVALAETVGEPHDAVDAIVLDTDGMLHPINDIIYLSIDEHQHLMAEKERRIERLEHCLEWLAAGFGGMWGSETKMWYDHALETAPDMIKAALQEEQYYGKSTPRFMSLL